MEGPRGPSICNDGRRSKRGGEVRDVRKWGPDDVKGPRVSTLSNANAQPCPRLKVLYVMAAPVHLVCHCRGVRRGSTGIPTIAPSYIHNCCGCTMYHFRPMMNRQLHLMFWIWNDSGHDVPLTATPNEARRAP